MVGLGSLCASAINSILMSLKKKNQQERFLGISSASNIGPGWCRRSRWASGEHNNCFMADMNEDAGSQTCFPQAPLPSPVPASPASTHPKAPAQPTCFAEAAWSPRRAARLSSRRGSPRSPRRAARLSSRRGSPTPAHRQGGLLAPGPQV